MNQRKWFELWDGGDSSERVCFAQEHISMVQKLATGGSLVVCGGIRYEFGKVDYERALELAGFVRGQEFGAGGK